MWTLYPGNLNVEVLSLVGGYFNSVDQNDSVKSVDDLLF